MLRSLLIAECAVFFGFYFFGERGVPLLRELHHENKAYIREIIVLEEEIQKIQQQIDEWNTYPFYKEQVAREELQLINPGDTIYLVKN